MVNMSMTLDLTRNMHALDVQEMCFIPYNFCVLLSKDTRFAVLNGVTVDVSSSTYNGLKLKFGML